MGRLLLAVLTAPIAFGGLMKLRDPRPFEGFIASLVGSSRWRPSGRFVAASELALVAGIAVMGFSASSAVLLAAFYVSAGVTRLLVWRRGGPECGCLGGLERRLADTTMNLAVSLLGLASAGVAAVESPKVGAPLTVGALTLTALTVRARAAIGAGSAEGQVRSLERGRRDFLKVALAGALGVALAPTAARASISGSNARVSVMPLDAAMRDRVVGSAALLQLLRHAGVQLTDLDWSRAALHRHENIARTKLQEIIAVPIRNRPGLVAVPVMAGSDIAVYSVGPDDALAYVAGHGLFKSAGAAFADVDAPLLPQDVGCEAYGTVCCGACGFTGPGWGTCCGVCAIGTIVCILILGIPPQP